MKRVKGFTLVELLAVMAIIAVLMAIVVPKIGDAVGKARRVSCTNNMKLIVKALQMYENDHNHSFIKDAANFGADGDRMDDIAGYLYYIGVSQRDGEPISGITSMKEWVCPASGTLPPSPAAGGYSTTLDISAAGAGIDYGIFLANNTFQYFKDPDKNQILADKDLTPGTGDYAHSLGANVATWDSAVKFYAEGTGATVTLNADSVSGAENAAGNITAANQFIQDDVAAGTWTAP